VRLCSARCCWLAWVPGSWWLSAAWPSAHSNPSLVIWMARMRFWPGLVAQPDRCIIHRNEGLIQVMRSRLKGAAKSAGGNRRTPLSAASTPGRR
jgi:hypothetical protein